MEPENLAAALVDAETAECESIIDGLSPDEGPPLARALRQLYLRYVASDRAGALRTAGALGMLSAHWPDNQEVAGLSRWTAGLAAFQIDGDMQKATELLTRAQSDFLDCGKDLDAAATQVALVGALAVLGRYEEAVARGARARDVFLQLGDGAAAGRMEQNLGIIEFRRGHFAESEEYERSARARFLELKNEAQLAQVDICLANAVKWQHRFDEAEGLLAEALSLAQTAEQHVTAAEVEHNLGYLELLRGRYGIALQRLERARQRFEELGMAPESDDAARDLAEAYLELNLAPEAAAICSELEPRLEARGKWGDLASVLACHGQASAASGQADSALPLLERAEAIFDTEDNPVGASLAVLARARLALESGDVYLARRAATSVEDRLGNTSSWRLLLEAKWLAGECDRRDGRLDEARRTLSSAAAQAVARTVPAIVPQCHTSLGLVEAAAGDAAAAEDAFRSAIEAIERLRRPLPGEEFRTAFGASRTTPYTELVRLCLGAPDGPRLEAAFDYAEQGRSQVLAERLGGPEQSTMAPDAHSARLTLRLSQLREELNWYYAMMERPPEPGAAFDSGVIEGLVAQADEHEREIAAVARQLAQLNPESNARAVRFSLSQLQSALGPDAVLIEYTTLDDEILAFLVTGDSLDVVRDVGSLQAVNGALAQFRFQVETFKYGGKLASHMDQLTRRANTQLAILHAQLLERLVGRLAGRTRVVIVPTGSLHYVPFNGLFDGEQYATEKYEIATAPSAAIFTHAVARTGGSRAAPLLVAVETAETPLVREEVEALAAALPGARTLVGDSATAQAIREQAPAAGLLHLACHGRFRPDNPLFSALRLADGWFSVRDARGLKLRCDVVTLSACETGLSSVAPGDELTGLAGTFLAAGAASLVVSLWTVDDAATAGFMLDFYEHLGRGERVSAALRAAQTNLLAARPHPFYWAPFISIGSW